VASPAEPGWVDVCGLDDLSADRGRAALVHGHRVALFRLSPDDDLFAIDDLDPFCGAPVLSRGLVGTTGDRPKVASPMYKQGFDLATGVCLSDPSVSVTVYPVRRAGDRVQVRVLPQAVVQPRGGTDNDADARP